MSRRLTGKIRTKLLHSKRMANKRVQATLYSAPDPWRWAKMEK
jgi:hypothetical protein